MRTINKIVILLCIMLSSCSIKNDDIAVFDDKSLLVSNARTNGTNNVSWKEGTIMTVVDNDNGIENIYTYVSGKWSLNESQDYIKWNKNGTLDVCAYINSPGFEKEKIVLPLNERGRIDQSTEEKMSLYDYLYYRNKTAECNEDGSIKGFCLRHLMSKVVLKISLSNNFSGSVTNGFSGVVFSSKKIMYYIDEKWVGENKVGRDVYPFVGEYDVEQKSQTFIAYIVPTGDDYWECEIPINTDDRKFTATAQNIRLESGKIYNLSLTLSENGIKWNEDIVVEDWGESLFLEGNKEYILEQWDGLTPEVYEFQGKGTEDDPFLIRNGAELSYISKALREYNSDSGKYIQSMASAYYKFVSDIDMGNIPISPINSSLKLSMKFIGNGHTIYNLNIGKGDNYTALVESGSVSFKDLILENIKSSGGKHPTSAFLGYYNAKNDVVIDNCHIVNGCIAGDGISGSFVGGTPKGGGSKKIKIIGCSVTDSSISGVCCGGLVGENYSLVNEIVGCYSCNNKILGSEISGGIIGKLSDRKENIDEKTNINITSSYSWNNVYGDSSIIGSFIGKISEGLPKDLTFNSCCFNHQIISDDLYLNAVGAFVLTENNGVVESEMLSYTIEDNHKWKGIDLINDEYIREMNKNLKEYSDNNSLFYWNEYTRYYKYPLIINKYRYE